MMVSLLLAERSRGELVDNREFDLSLKLRLLTLDVLVPTYHRARCIKCSLFVEPAAVNLKWILPAFYGRFCS
jgi:hypothetical protein